MASTSTRLLVLGFVRKNGPVHGYDLRRDVLSWGGDKWANVTAGSIYNALKALVQEGSLEVVGRGRQGARPERTTYQLTDAGEQEFQRLLQENLWDSRLPNHPLLVGLAFFPLFPREELSAAMRQRATELRGQSDFYRRQSREMAAGDGDRSDTGVPRYFAENILLAATLLDSEAAWAQEFSERLESGELDELWPADCPSDQ